MKTYKSRISIVLVLFLALACFGIPFVCSGANITKHFISVSMFIFVCIIVSFCGIKYVIDGETLKIFYFYGIHKDINIKTITKMEPSCNPISSPAASLKRLAVYYGKNDVVYISPRNQEDFIKQINDVREAN